MRQQDLDQQHPEAVFREIRASRRSRRQAIPTVPRIHAAQMRGAQRRDACGRGKGGLDLAGPRPRGCRRSEEMAVAVANVQCEAEAAGSMACRCVDSGSSDGSKLASGPSPATRTQLRPAALAA
jgi:hypothetical protein